MDEKQWGKRRRDRKQGIERKRISKTVGGEGGREKERGEEKGVRYTHVCAHTHTHTHTRDGETKPRALQAPATVPDPRSPHSQPGVPQLGLWPTWLVSNHMEHAGLAFVPDRLQETVGVKGKVALGRALAAPTARECSPRLGGSGWAALVPAGRTALRAGPPWGRGV